MNNTIGMSNVDPSNQLFTLFANQQILDFLKQQINIDHITPKKLAILIIAAGCTSFASNKISSIINGTFNQIEAWSWITYMRIKQRLTIHKRSSRRTVSTITQDKQHNFLYNAVSWYLKSQINLNTEPIAEVSYTKEILPTDSKSVNFLENKLFPLERSLPMEMAKSIKFKNTTIHFHFTKDVQDVYGAEEVKKRERRSIVLNSLLSKKCENDVLTEFCNFCIIEYSHHLGSRKWTQKVFTNENGQWKEKPDHQNARAIRTVILRDEREKEVKKDFKYFLKSEEKYKKLGVLYTRTYLFQGPPGTGKTSLVMALSNVGERNIYYLRLNEIKSDQELTELFRQIPVSCSMLLIEDIDAQTEVVLQREKENKEKKKDEIPKENVSTNFPNIPMMPTNTPLQPMGQFMGQPMGQYLQPNASQPSTLTLSGILNCLDGLFSRHGLVTIMTTNHMKKLDGALLRRGRTDKIVHFQLCDKAQIKRIYKLFYDDEPDMDILNSIPGDRIPPCDVMATCFEHRNPDDGKKALESIYHKAISEEKEEK